jgi:site-specific DNA-cytosine methylase
MMKQIVFSDITSTLSAADGEKGVHSQMMKAPESNFVVEIRGGYEMNNQTVYDPSVHHGFKQFDNVCETVRARYGTGGNCTPYVINNKEGDEMKETNAVVRRLTPLECSRLQGLPDGWVEIGDWVDENGKKHKDADAPKYKALGNGIALPFWQWLAYRITDQLKADGVENPTLFSMFDGIGSFCLAFKRAGCEPVAVSEIEPYPIAVCKKHFGDEETGEVGDVEKYL